jgi:hypothetical protein
LERDTVTVSRDVSLRTRTPRALAPLDATLELPDEHHSYEVRRIAAEESARGSCDEVAELIAKRTGAHVPRRQIVQLTVRAAHDFDALYADRLCEPEVEKAATHLVKHTPLLHYGRALADGLPIATGVI